VLQCAKAVSVEEINESIVNFENQENVEYQAFKMIQRPNFNDKSYLDQKIIFMNDATVLEAIQGHPNIVKLIEVIPSGIVETADSSSGGAQRLHVDYAMAIECLRGGELYYNMQKFGRLPPAAAHYFFSQILDAIKHMHSRGFCHRDLKPWNVMLTDDLSNAKVIDFSYSTPLIKSDFEKAPEILHRFLPGTKQFMAPEQMDEESYPIMSDFSKIDVFALGVLLINMLTLDYAFESATEDNQGYEKFMNDPQQFFVEHGVQFHSDEEMQDCCALLTSMLQFDLDKRISIQDAQKMPYMSSQKVPRMRSDQVRRLMNKRLRTDETLIGLDKSLEPIQGVPVYIPFSWQTPIIRHTFQRGCTMDDILDQYQVAINKMCEELSAPSLTL
jgi:serine/threonine protein kinase